MKIYFDKEYTGAKYAFDTTRKADHLASAVRRRALPGIDLIEPPRWAIEAAASGIELMHHADYVSALRTGDDPNLAESQGFTWCPEIWDMAVHSTAGLIAATASALDDGVAGSLSSGLHHASPSRGKGYCTVNGLAIAARRLAADAKHVVILDLDAHCGGGTSAMIRTHDLSGSVRQFDVSTDNFDHYEPADPADRLVVIDGDEPYIDAVTSMLDEINWDDTDIVLYNAGVDPHPGISRLGITLRERMVFTRAAAENTPVAWVLAGGYTGAMSMEGLVDLHWQTIDAAQTAANGEKDQHVQ